MTRVDWQLSERGREILSELSRERATLDEIEARLLAMIPQIYCQEELSPAAWLQTIAADLGRMFGVSTDAATDWLLAAMEDRPLKPNAP